MNRPKKNNKGKPKEGKDKAISLYHKTTIMTAGKLPSIIMLLRKAEKLVNAAVSQPDENSGGKLLHARNIIAQLQLALNFKKGASAHLFMQLFDDIYQRLEFPTQESLQSAHIMIRNFSLAMGEAAK